MSSAVGDFKQFPILLIQASMAEQQLSSVEAVESYFTLVTITTKVRGTTHLYPLPIKATSGLSNTSSKKTLEMICRLLMAEILCVIPPTIHKPAHLAFFIQVEVQCGLSSSRRVLVYSLIQFHSFQLAISMRLNIQYLRFSEINLPL